MLSAVMEVDLECESIAWLSGDERDRFSTRRRARPAVAWFDTRSSVGWSQSEADFVGRPSSECRMRTTLVVPGDEGTEISEKTRAAMRNQNPASAFVFHGSDEPLDYSDAPVFSSRAEARTDSLSSAPIFEALAPEDTVLSRKQDTWATRYPEPLSYRRMCEPRATWAAWQRRQEPSHVGSSGL